MATNGRFGRTGAWAAAFLALALGQAGHAADYPAGFTEEIVLDGLAQPTQAAFIADGRIVVAEKSGVVKVFDGPGDTTPQVLIDLSLAVHDYWDRGLLGLAVDPDFAQRPYVYVLYTHNFDPDDSGSVFPRWPTNDCPSVPGPTTDGCVVNGRLSRLELAPDNTLVGGEHVLLEGGWCAQFPSHSVGTLVFDSAGALIVSAGDGANAADTDWGQYGGSPTSPVPSNPCDDPPGGRGVALSPPDAEGGALRAQDLRTAGDPVTWTGSVLRVDPDTGAAWPTNPLIGGDPDDDRVVAYGLRNPFRIARRPGTDEIWIGDVGWRSWEELNRLVVPTAGALPNFGWPCFEGAERQPSYDDADLDLCESLYAEQQDPAREPFFAYRRGVAVDPDPAPTDDPDALRCSRIGGSAISGLAFVDPALDGNYPSEFDGALFFADFPRQCIFVMRAGPDGVPDPATRATFGDRIPAPAQLLAGLDGALHYLNLANGRLVRIAWYDTNTPPTAIAVADQTAGVLPLTVRFDAAQSTDPDDGATLTYAWDLDGDGAFDDSDLVAPSFTYVIAGEYIVRLRVTDDRGEAADTALSVTAGNTPPEVTITSPTPDLRWRAGDPIAFAGTAIDDEDGPRPATAFHWEVVLHACNESPDECTQHVVAEFHGVSAGTFSAPDQPGHSRLELIARVTDDGFGARDGGVLTGIARQELTAQTVVLTFDTQPSGLALWVDGTTATTPFARTTVVGATSQLGAPDPQPGIGGIHRFLYWSDSGAATHAVTAPAEAARIEAVFVFDCLDDTCSTVLRVSPAGSAVAPFTTVQAAIDALPVGASVEVLPGRYAENVVVDRGFPVRIVARDDGSGLPVTIDGGAGVALELTGPAAVAVRGLTFEGAVGLRAGAPTHLEDLRFAVSDLALDLVDGQHVATNLAVAPGAGAGIVIAEPAVLDLDRAELPSVSTTAIAIAGTARARNVLIYESGTAVAAAAGSNLDLAHATIVDNADRGIDAQGTDAVSVLASIVANNGTDGASDIVGVPCGRLQSTASGRLDCAGQNGNLADPPRLDANFRPLDGSPVLDAGGLIDAADPCTDLAGGPRFVDADGDGLAQIDLGAFERVNPDRFDAVDGLRWNSSNELVWTPAVWAATYHVYRGTPVELSAPAGLPCADGIDFDRTDAAVHDPQSPPPASLFVYIVTGESQAGIAGSPGRRTCAERTIAQPCP